MRLMSRGNNVERCDTSCKSAIKNAFIIIRSERSYSPFTFVMPSYHLMLMLMILFLFSTTVPSFPHSPHAISLLAENEGKKSACGTLP